MPLRILAWLLVLPAVLSAVSVRRAVVSDTADERFCAAPKPVALFQSAHRQAFLWFIAEQVRNSDRLRVEWVDPSGGVAETTAYGELPDSPALCFVTHLPIAGFAPASQPGAWSARVIAGEKVLASRQFRIAGDPGAGGLRIASVVSSGDEEHDLTLVGAGFRADSVVYIAQYTSAAGWKYLARLDPAAAASNRLLVRHSGLAPGEYLVVVRNPDGETSAPARLLIRARRYKLPTVAGEAWILTQAPYGAFSHWGNSTHAWDLAPRASLCVVAMRGGIVYTFDRGMKRTLSRRTFGNYVTIDHGDGEYSHYAHLASGTFVVASGQRVEAGQALAVAGNSGYSLGANGGRHVHVHVTRAKNIASQSVPFEFDDLPSPPRPGALAAVVSTNASPLCECVKQGPGAGFQAAVEAGGRWNETVRVPRGAARLEITLTWAEAGADLDLHLMSPSGRHHGWYGDRSGYTGSESNAEVFRLPQPEPGYWSVWVEARRAGAGPVAFQVTGTWIVERGSWAHDPQSTWRPPP